MGISATVLAASALGVATVGTAYSIYSSERAAKSSRRLQRARATQEKRSQLREARIRRANIMNLAANVGTTGSSSALGGAGSIQSQLSGNLSFIDEGLSLQEAISKNQQRSQLFGSIANLGSSVFSAAGGFSALENKGSAIPANPEPLFNETIFE